MSSWESREADVLAQALAKHCRDNPEDPAGNAVLAPVLAAAEAAADADDTSLAQLQALRGQLCTICRERKLYDCDVAYGWSERCTLVHTNTTEFGSL